MSRSVPFIVFLLLHLSISAYGETDALFGELDSEIEKFPHRLERKKARINELRNRFNSYESDSPRYSVAYDLYLENRSLVNDSAIKYLDICHDIALHEGWMDRARHSDLLKANQFVLGGYYKEAFDIMESTDVEPESPEDEILYHTVYSLLYNEMAVHSVLPRQREEFLERQSEYVAGIVEALQGASDYGQHLRVSIAMDTDSLEKALYLNGRRLKMLTDTDREYGGAAYSEYLIHHKLGNDEEARKWLIRAAISDLKNVTTDQAALPELAMMLYREGDVERAFRYIHLSCECIRMFNSKERSARIASFLDLIDSHNQKEIKQKSLYLKISLSVLAFILILTALTLIAKIRQKRILEKTQRELISTNSEINGLNSRLKVSLEEQETLSEKASDLNRKLTEANSRLADTNSELADTNWKLKEANDIKEEYIGRFMELCGVYIDKYIDFKNTLYRKMKTGDLNEYLLSHDSSSSHIKAKELEFLYRNFDNAFLKLFPNFVNDLNDLLKPEFRIRPLDGGRLTTEQRICALIRLNISESAQIASCLHFSANTIYNYRAQLRGKALGDRDDFENRLRLL